MLEHSFVRTDLNYRLRRSPVRPYLDNLATSSSITVQMHPLIYNAPQSALHVQQSAQEKGGKVTHGVNQIRLP